MFKKNIFYRIFFKERCRQKSRKVHDNHSLTKYKYSCINVPNRIHIAYQMIGEVVQTFVALMLIVQVYSET